MQHNNVNKGNNGIVKIRQYDEEYLVWTHANVVRPYIKKFLSEQFPKKLIIRELNQIDLSIPEENLPIEIQSTLSMSTEKNWILYSQWEQKIRSQIEQNIISYDRCWFFFDSELLRAMKNAGKMMSINMDWFRKFMKEEKLKVFTISHDGIIEEKLYKHFDFLSEHSQTCPIATEKDDIILNRNKMKIFTNVIKGYGFAQEEIDKFDNDFKCSNIGDNLISFLKKQDNERYRLYGYILHAIGNLSGINELLDKKVMLKSSKNSAKQSGKFLGIFDVRGFTKDVITKFIDIFDICKYFPGYLRNKETWNKLKGLNLNNRQFDNIITGKNDVINGLDYYFKEK